MRIEGPWSEDVLRGYLGEAVIPLRLGVLARDGCPRVVSLWFEALDDALWCATSADASVIDWLTRNGRCGFEIAPESPPYRGVRGSATASLHPERGVEILSRLARRYLGERPTPFSRWLLGRDTPEIAIRIEPRVWSTWDYTARMG